MKRSVIVGTTALLAGLLLAITAFAAPFRSYDRAAGDQYTTTHPNPPACTNTTGSAPEHNPNCQTTTAAAPTSAIAGQSATSRDGQGTPTPVGPRGARSDSLAATETDESGVASDEDSGAGAGSGSAPSGANGAGSGGGSAQEAARSTIAYLFVGDQPKALAPTLIKITGIPAWAGATTDLDATALDRLAAGTPFAGLGATPVDLRKLRGLARLVGADSVPATGISGRLPDLVEVFVGAVKPIGGLVLARTKIADAGDRRNAEAFQRAFAVGALRSDIPVVGVELNRSRPSSIAYFKKIRGASSVDDVDTKRGAISLSRLLAGAKPGHYGRRDSATAPVPPTIAAAAASASLQDGGGSLGGSPLLVGLLLTMALLAGRALVTVVQRTRTQRH